MASDVGGCATGGFVEAKGEAKAVLLSAETGRGQHAERTTDHSHLVGEDVAKHVLGEQYVKLVGVTGELHGCIVHIHVTELDLGSVLSEVFRNDPAPEDGGFEDVGLVDRADAVAAGSGRVDGDLSDTLDLAGLVNHRVDGLLFAVVQRGGRLGLTEIDAAGQFAYTDNIDAIRDALLLEWGCVRQLRVE